MEKDKNKNTVSKVAKAYKVDSSTINIELTNLKSDPNSKPPPKKPSTSKKNVKKAASSHASSSSFGFSCLKVLGHIGWYLLVAIKWIIVLLLQTLWHIGIHLFSNWIMLIIVLLALINAPWVIRTYIFGEASNGIDPRKGNQLQQS